MKILHLTYSGREGGGGGAVSMHRLHTGLRKSGLDSKVLCVTGREPDPDYLSINDAEYNGKAVRYRKALAKRLGLTGFDGVRPAAITKHKAFIDADVVQIHRLLGVTPYVALPSLTEKKPTILTLCDTWAITGRCYNNLNCNRWKSGCGVCPNTNVFPIARHDASYLEWHLKRWTYDHSRLTAVSKSTWMTEMLQQSILNKSPIHQIPNGIDIQAYKPLDKIECRSILKISASKYVLMFGALDLGNHIKGADLLLEALKMLPKSIKEECVLITMGKNSSATWDVAGIQTLSLGLLEHDDIKNRAYSAADVFLCPSRGEALGNVIIEAMASGTPVVAFQVGGIPDLVRSKMTGILAKPWDTREFSRGILELLEDDILRNEISQRSRKLIVDEFSLDLQVEKYCRLYNSMIQ